ncbi:MAG TPA: SMP-30/gluconolactonase/LRE family protein [Paraburkholderia sp.]|uniref:SMP-30/gluconolactonase/LRE family protein n=1 Tax=Paraburkholderia sp. TaxID=1926495 RepID=UPI002C0ADE41|nr:SMP-30/gluconolactonase/LRE family protein [Paraburkholderia sp.]HTR05391.1 SMP-30/gluconolactonase/LRE family protein [Paraburkholderia sp.]
MSANEGASSDVVAELLVDSKCELGEGATWCARSGRLYWTDIEGKRLARYDARDGKHVTWEMPERLACFALCEDERTLLLGLASRLAFFDLETGAIETIVEVEPGVPTRLNDGRCDRLGRFVFGTKYEGSPRQAIGGFYRLNHDLTLERLPLPAPAISNSIAFSPDGATMYYCDSPTREIRACDYGADGTIANQRTFVTLADDTGVPDGSTVDAEGGLWNAQWGGARVVRYGADGREMERVKIPTAQPSCVTLGGALLDTLYVTSAREEMDEATLAREPQAGGVFAVRVGRRGLEEPRFQGHRRA